MAGISAIPAQSSATLIQSAGRQQPTLITNYGQGPLPYQTFPSEISTGAFGDSSQILLSRRSFSLNPAASPGSSYGNVEIVLLVGESILLDPDSDWYAAAITGSGSGEVLIGQLDTDYGKSEASPGGLTGALAALLMNGQSFLNTGGLFGSDPRLFSSYSTIAAGGQSVPNSGVSATVINMTTAYDGDPSNDITVVNASNDIRLPRGNYKITGGIAYAATTNTGRRVAILNVNGAAVQQQEQAPAAANAAQQFTFDPYELCVNLPVTISMSIYQTSGAVVPINVGSAYLNAKEILR